MPSETDRTLIEVAWSQKINRLRRIGCGREAMNNERSTAIRHGISMPHFINTIFCTGGDVEDVGDQLLGDAHVSTVSEKE